MRPFRPRFTIRQSMVLVAMTGVVSWLTGTAVHVHRDPSSFVLCHIRQNLVSGECYGITHGGWDGTFWSRYRRALLGQPWPGSYQCPCTEKYRKPNFVEIYSCVDQKEFHDRMLRLGQEWNESRPKGPLDCLDDFLERNHTKIDRLFTLARILARVI